MELGSCNPSLPPSTPRMLGNVSSCWFFPYTCLETLAFSFLSPIMIFTQYVDSCTQWVSEQYTCSGSWAIPVSTNCKLIFLLSSFFPELSWLHLSHKWSLIRARAWWASNLIFTDNSFSTTGVGWFGFVFFLFPSFLSGVSAAGKLCLDGFISCGEVGL